MPWASLPSRNLKLFYRISVPGNGESIDPTLNEQWNAGEDLEIDDTRPTILFFHVQLCDSRM